MDENSPSLNNEKRFKFLERVWEDVKSDDFLSMTANIAELQEAFPVTREQALVIATLVLHRLNNMALTKDECPVYRDRWNPVIEIINLKKF